MGRGVTTTGENLVLPKFIGSYFLFIVLEYDYITYLITCLPRINLWLRPCRGEKLGILCILHVAEFKTPEALRHTYNWPFKRQKQVAHKNRKSFVLHIYLCPSNVKFVIINSYEHRIVRRASNVRFNIDNGCISVGASRRCQAPQNLRIFIRRNLLVPWVLFLQHMYEFQIKFWLAASRLHCSFFYLVSNIQNVSFTN